MFQKNKHVAHNHIISLDLVAVLFCSIETSVLCVWLENSFSA